MSSHSTGESISVAEIKRTGRGGLVPAFLALLVLMFISVVSNAQVTLFSDDFQAYTQGTGIAGQGGWYARNPSQAPILVSTGSGLGSSVLNGGIRTGDGNYTDANMPVVLHSLSGPLSAGGISKISIEAYGFSNYRSHAAGVGFASADLGEIFYWVADWYGHPRETPKWTFAGTGVGDNSIFSGGFDQRITLEVIVDGAAGEVYGRLTHSGGSYETTRFAITPAQLSSLTEVMIFEDFRDSLYLGAEFDNINVSSATLNYRLPFVGLKYISNGPGCGTGSSRHQGFTAEAIDYAMVIGTPIYASEAGVIEFVGSLPKRPGKDLSGFGLFVVVSHGDGRKSYYAHLFSSGVVLGVNVTKGQIIGYSGDSGKAKGQPHLHFQIMDATGTPVSIRTLPDTTWYSGNPDAPCNPLPKTRDGEAVGPPVP